MSQLLNGLWNFCQEVWKTRNSGKHSEDKKAALVIKQVSLAAQVTNIYINRPKVGAHFSFLFARSLKISSQKKTGIKDVDPTTILIFTELCSAHQHDHQAQQADLWSYQ